MTESSSGSTFFSIPELVALLSEYMEPRDIARSMATCKNCARLFEPYLWRHITIQHYRATKDVVRRNRHHAVTLVIGSPFGVDFKGCLEILAGSAQSTPSMPSESRTSTSAHRRCGPRDSPKNRPLDLRHITVLAVIPTRSRSHTRDILYRIITQCRRLITLEFPLQRSHKNRLQVLRPILEAQSNLRALTITKESTCPMQDFALLLELCLRHPTINDLRCHFPLFRQDTNAELWNNFSTISSHLKSLDMPAIFSGSSTHEFLLPILRSCGPNLECLSISNQSYSSDSNKAVLALIRGSVGRGLVSFRAGCNIKDPYQSANPIADVLKALVDHHSTTLEDLQFDAVRSATSWEQAEILARCSNLKRFWIAPAGYGLISVEISHLLSSEWTCLGLRELCLTLDRRITGSEQEPIANLAHRVYAQIGRLRRLEKLSLGCYTFGFGGGNEGNSEMDLTLNSGFLAELEGLSELKEFEMTSDYWTFMGQAEVEFMNRYWPKLRKITFGSPMRAMGMRAYDATSRSHWQWLVKRRQSLEYDVHRLSFDLISQVLPNIDLIFHQ
ncbi:hypothetical protein BGZ58_011031 [Dissophora ornata]|nr:hypothetical protein BGZ58_011031 [Dissophora ornata]